MKDIASRDGRNNMGNKVIVLGAGVAGLSAAHELVERGFEVEVYEARMPGGKARSAPFPGSGTGTRKDLPSEHGFRFFPGFYKHVTDTMKRIPYEGQARGVFDNLIDTAEVAFTIYNKPPMVLPARAPRGAKGLLHDLVLFLRTYLDNGANIPIHEFMYFVERVWQVMTSCDERRLREYEAESWWSYTGAAQRSDHYQKFFVYSLTRTLAASRADQASTRTVGNTFIQLFLTTVLPGVATDRILNGPTNDVWIDPWLEYLIGKGVKYQNQRVVSINCFGKGGAGRVKGVRLANNIEVIGDYYIACLPVEAMASLITQELLDLDPSLVNVRILARNVEWMNGIQFYLNQAFPIANGHVAYVDSQWKLTSVSQSQFWPKTNLASYGTGNVKDVLSVVISEWDKPGLNGKTAKDCTKEEIRDEVWEELKQSLSNAGPAALKDAYLVSWFLDPDIQHSGGPGIWQNLEPLFVNLINTWSLRPDACTRIHNLFLAADYVKTYTDIACMEAANEAARRAVNCIVQSSKFSVQPCQLWPLLEPADLDVYKSLDRHRFIDGLPWKNPIWFPEDELRLIFLEGLESI
jgi:uncharacterized protein with NAD-binding domain and iron-sulfur cluster